MAKLGDLVVRIGADTRDLNKSLGRVQRNMRSMTGNFTRLGESMTRSLTLPIVAIGAAAVKSAADLETLETSFVSLTGGVDQAASMMKQLNEFTAQTPFQIDAVANSARQLIASGTRVSEVNEQLQFLGDIAATSGNSIEEIAAIFAKVNAKGKVELENLNQLAERGVPIFTALADATGLPADKLGAGAVSVQQFNDVLKGFAEQGGFAQGAMERLSQTAAGKLSTAIDNLKIAGAGLVETIMPRLQRALEIVTDFSQRLTKLDPNIRALIVNLGLLTATFGPILTFLPQIVTQFKAITALIGGGGIGLAIAALTALITTFATLRKEVVTISDRLGDAQRKANDNAAEAISNARVLVAEFGRENTSMERKTELLNQLQVISPKYYGHLKTATTTVDLLTEATNRYTASIKAQARQLAIQEAQEDQLKAIASRQREVLEFERKRNKLIAEYDENLDGIIDFQEQINMGGFAAEDLRLLNAQIRAGEQDVERMTNELIDFENQFGNVGLSVNDLLRDLDSYGTVMSDATETTDDYNKSSQNTVTTLGQLFSKLENVTVGAHRAKMSMGEFFSMLENVEVASDRIAETTTSMAQTIAGAFEAAARSARNFADFLRQVTVDIVASYLRQAAAKALATGNLAGAIGLGIASGLTQRIGVPALAQGGVAYGPTMAMIGDNRNAAIDPEVVAPLSKLRDMMGGNQVEVFGRIQGNDIYLSNARTGTSRNRYA